MDCNGTTESVFDHATGDVICTHCGLVLDSHCIDDTPEWRTFTNDHSNSDHHDPNRVGYSSNPFFSSHLSTLISKPTGPKPDSGLLGLDTLHKMIKNPEAQLEKALATIDNMGEQLGVISSIKEHAKLIYTNLTSTNSHKPPSCFRGKYHDAFLGACLYVACNHEGLPRTVKEISWVANGASKKDILRGKAAYISKQLVADETILIKMETTMDRVVRAGDLVKRFCSNIGVMNSKVMKAAQETVAKLEDEMDIRRSPVSVAAAVVYVIRQLMSCDDDNNNNNKKKGNNNNNNNNDIIQEIAKATGVAQGTIKNAY